MEEGMSIGKAPPLEIPNSGFVNKEFSFKKP
jgi:hypothetical protein